jgi:methionyl-tRNA synthetase
MKYYVTTAIDYVNAQPHLGHAYEKVLADVLARQARLTYGPVNVRFQGGTDEHGVKNYRAAREAGQEPGPFTAANSERFLALRESLGVSWDDFIKTTDQKRHWPAAQELWRRLEQNGDLEKRTYQGYYCVGCESFKTEKEIENGHCIFHPTRELELLEEENWFFRLSKYQGWLQDHFRENPDFVQPAFRAREILNVIEGGLEDVSFSRAKEKLPWGVPVPGDDSQVMYVWCDALTNYISAVGFPDEEKLAEWWRPEAAVTHVIGKDIVRFHAALWPAMLRSAGLPLPDHVFVHGFINLGGEKLSKSAGLSLDPFDLAGTYGADALRYFLLSQIGVGQDGEFSVERFEAVYAADLANNLGNLVQRVATLAERGGLSGREAKEPSLEPELVLERKDFRAALQSIWQVFDATNTKIELEKPWELKDSDPERYERVLGECADSILVGAASLRPFLPETAERIEAVFTAPKVAAPSEPLFPRLDR